jgi:hypothetical protein
LYICAPANNSLRGESLIICLVIEYWKYNLFVSSSFIVTLCLETLGAWQIKIQIHIRLQYTCWQMAQQFNLFIAFILLGEFIFYLFEVKLYFIFATCNKYFIYVCTEDGPRRTSRWAHLSRSQYYHPTIAGICFFAQCLISLSECSTWAQRCSTAARPRLGQG